MSIDVWLPALLVFVSVALGTVALVLAGESAAAGLRRQAIRRRLAEGGIEPLLDETLGRPELARAAPRHNRLDDRLAQLPHFHDLPILLRQADVRWSERSYLLLVLGAAAACGFAVLVLTHLLVAGAVAAAGGAALPYLHIRRRRRRRIAAFEERFPEAIDLLARAIRAGHPLSSGIKMVAEEAPEPVAGEFRQVFEQQRFGLPFEDALAALADRVELVDVRIFVTAVLIQRESGGNLAEVLDKISQTIRARFSVRRQIRTYTAQGRLTGYVLAAVPILLTIAIYFLDREYIMVLFTHPIGRIMVAMALGLQIIGYVWIRKVINIEV